MTIRAVSRPSNPAGLVVAAAMVVGFVFSGPASGLEPALTSILMGLMFMGCLDVRPGPLVDTLKRPGRVTAVLATIHLLPALIAWRLAPLLGHDLGVGLVLAAATSSGFSVVFLSQLLGGRPGQALPLTVLSNASTPVVLPAVVAALAGASVVVEPLAMARGIGLIVGLPLVAAAAVGRTPAGPWLKAKGRPLSLGLLFALIVGVIAQVRDQLVQRPAEALVVLAIVSGLVLACFAVGWFLGRDRPERITLGLVGSYKNYTLATVVALEFLGPTAAIPAVVYAIVNNAALAPMQLLAPSAPAADPDGEADQPEQPRG